ncbi:hypothetical protein HZA41_01760, partial [Candidatus Peregrinibacteria bacterium]|nr:hypothetical protein [Candidatus Peregrinibacteria bacterium]
MRKIPSILLVTILLLISVETALALNAPIIDPVKSPVDATKQKITGTTEPSAKITVTGGPYEISPITADKNGHFEITVALVKESTNLFSIIAEKDGQISSSTKIEIVENAEQAALAAAGGTDNIAPAAPIVTETTQGTGNAYSIVGTAEANSTIEISGTVTGTTKTSAYGTFSIQINLKEGQKNRL